MSDNQTTRTYACVTAELQARRAFLGAIERTVKLTIDYSGYEINSTTNETTALAATCDELVSGTDVRWSAISVQAESGRFRTEWPEVAFTGRPIEVELIIRRYLNGDDVEVAHVLRGATD